LAGQTYNCVLDFTSNPIPPNHFTEFSVMAQVGNVGAPGQPVTLTNTATLTVAGDPNPANDVSSASVTVTDLTPPVITACAPPVNLGASAAGQATLPDMTGGVQANDNWPGPLAIVQNPAAGTLLGIGTYPVDFTVTDGEGNSGMCQSSVIVQDVTPPTLTLPGNITTLATSSAGATVNYTATADDGIFGPLTPTCMPPSGSTFPIGTTTVNCDVADAAGNRTSGSFTITVNVGTPSLLGVIAAKGRDGAGNFFVDLRLANSGTGHARNVALTALTFRTLTGTGTVTYDAAISGPLPLAIGSIDAANVSTVRLYLNVPLTVRRFSMVESITLQDVVGTSFSLSLSHAVFP
jgi:hypothetical protein